MGTISKARYKLNVKTELCAGCERCVLVCSLIHTGVCNPALSRIKIVKDYFTGNFMQKVCKQCIVPACLVVCPAGAINIDLNTGATVVSNEKCIGCKMCVNACPLGLMLFDEEESKAFKCDLCGGNPQCVEICPMQAIEYAKIE